MHNKSNTDKYIINEENKEISELLKIKTKDSIILNKSTSIKRRNRIIKKENKSLINKKELINIFNKSNSLKKLLETGILKYTIHKNFIISKNNQFYVFYSPKTKEFSINFFEYFLYTKYTETEIIKLKFVSNELILIIFKTHIEIMNIFNKKIEFIEKESNLINAYYLNNEKILILEKEELIIHIFNKKRIEFPKEKFKIINNLIYINYKNILKEYDFLMNEIQRFSCYRLSDFYIYEGFLFTLSCNQLILANIEPILDINSTKLIVNKKYIFMYSPSKTIDGIYELKIFIKTEMIPKYLKNIFCSSFKIIGESNLFYLFENNLYLKILN